MSRARVLASPRAGLLVGADAMKWCFVCPACGNVASTQEYKDAGAPEAAVGFSCIGRYLGREVYRAFGENNPSVPKMPCSV